MLMMTEPHTVLFVALTWVEKTQVALDLLEQSTSIISLFSAHPAIQRDVPLTKVVLDLS